MSERAATLDPEGAAVVALDDRRSVAQRAVDGIARRMRSSRTGRRSFLTRAAVVGSALSVAPLRFLMRPVSADDAICGPANECADGWTVFCCTIHGGRNSCPPGTIAAGWWKADASPFCGGAARYIVDCNAQCALGCGCGASGICSPVCHSWRCTCGQGTCDRRRIACNAFRYGQCHQELACVGPVVCRVVSCVAPWQWDPSCTAASATANATRFHNAPCLGPTAGSVHAFGDARDRGDIRGGLRAPIVGIERTVTGKGYWLVASDGGIFSFGDARFLGSTGAIRLAQPVVDLAVQPDGRGYWLVAADGGVFSFGRAGFHGSTGAMRLNRPIVGAAATATGKGYWLAASDGGIFSFGDAHFFGSTGAMRLNQPVVGMAATPTGRGYWLVAADGGIFSFGDAHFFGSTGAMRLNQPIVGMAATPTGRGYWLVASDGGVFTFGDAWYFGSTAGLGERAVDLEPTGSGDGYWIASS